MREASHERHRVLAIYPFARGFAFCVLENPLTWLDSGTKCVDRLDSAKVWTAVKTLLQKHEVRVAAVEREAVSTRGKESLRCTAGLIVSARKSGFGLILVSDKDVRATLGANPNANRYEIGELLAEALPQLRPQRPKKRRAWDPEGERAKVFRAAGIAVGALYRLRAELP